MGRGVRNASKDVVLKRREIVSSLMARRLTPREICENIARPTKMVDGKLVPNPMHMINENTGLPYTVSMIEKDCIYLRKQMQKSIAANLEQHRADQFHELNEAKRHAWAKGNMQALARFIELEMKLLGTPMPDKVENRFDEEQLEMITRLTEARDTIQQRLKQLAERQAPAEVSD